MSPFSFSSVLFRPALQIILSEPQILPEKLVQLPFQGSREPFENIAHSPVLDFVHLATILSTLGNDSTPRKGFPEIRKSVFCQGFTSREDACCCWLPLASENQRQRMGYHLLHAPKKSGEVNCPFCRVDRFRRIHRGGGIVEV